MPSPSSPRTPLVAGLTTAAALTAGCVIWTLPAAADDTPSPTPEPTASDTPTPPPTPTPTQSPTTTAPTASPTPIWTPTSTPSATVSPSTGGAAHAPAMSVTLSLSAGTAVTGSTVTATVHVQASAWIHNTTVTFRATGASVAPAGRKSLGAVGTAGRNSSAGIHLPGAGTTVTVTATVTADHEAARTATSVLKVITVAGPTGATAPTVPSLYTNSTLPWSQTPKLPGSEVALPTATLDPAVAPQHLVQLAAGSSLINGRGSGPSLPLLVGIDSGWLSLLLLVGTTTVIRLRKS